MKQIIALAALALAAGCTASAETESLARADGEAKLATELRNHQQAGSPVSCVTLRNVEGNRAGGDGAIIFEGRGGGLWVNRPAGGCPALNHGRALLVRTTGSQLCRGEIVSIFDTQSGVSFGSCGLGDFTPYERRRDG